MPPITDPVVIAVVRQVQQELTPENYSQMEWCGAACCIAGHVERVARQMCPGRIQGRCFSRRAASVLGIDADDTTLFDGAPGCVWPEPFGSEWRYAEGHNHAGREFVDIARRRLDYFLEHGE
jgi:hypothetical protein